PGPEPAAAADGREGRAGRQGPAVPRPGEGRPRGEARQPRGGQGGARPAAGEVIPSGVGGGVLRPSRKRERRVEPFHPSLTLPARTATDPRDRPGREAS